MLILELTEFARFNCKYALSPTEINELVVPTKATPFNVLFVIGVNVTIGFAVRLVTSVEYKTVPF